MSDLHAPVWMPLRHVEHVVSGFFGGVAQNVAPHAVSQLPALHPHVMSALMNAFCASECAVVQQV
jgi:hypothetical protein